MNFNNILSQILEVDNKGFDATTDSYFNKIDTSGTNDPPVTNSASNKPNIATMSKGDRDNIRLALRKDQAVLTEALQNKYPNVPIDVILTKVQETSGYDRKNTSKYVDQYIKEYGDINLTKEETLKYAPNYYSNRAADDAFLKKEINDSNSYTKGTEETGDMEAFGLRNATNQYGYKKINVDKDKKETVTIFPVYEYLETKKNKKP